MDLYGHEPSHKKNVFNPDNLVKSNFFLEKLKNRIYVLNTETKLDIKNLLNESK